MKTRNGTDWATEVRATVTGMLTTTKTTESQARIDIKNQTAALESMYALGGKDLVLYMPDGVTRTGLELLEDDCLYGVEIISPPSYTDGKGAQGVTYRTFTIELAGLIPIPPSSLASQLQSFEETLEISTDDRFGWIQPRTGYGIQQQLAGQPLWHAVQRGSAEGLYQYPPVPGPVFFFARLGDAPLVTKGQPRRLKGQGKEAYVDWPISWQWRFTWYAELIGSPHVAGINY